MRTHCNKLPLSAGWAAGLAAQAELLADVLFGRLWPLGADPSRPRSPRPPEQQRCCSWPASMHSSAYSTLQAVSPGAPARLTGLSSGTLRNHCVHVSQSLWIAFETRMAWGGLVEVSYRNILFFHGCGKGKSAEYWRIIPFKVSRGYPAAETAFSIYTWKSYIFLTEGSYRNIEGFGFFLFLNVKTLASKLIKSNYVHVQHKPVKSLWALQL